MIKDWLSKWCEQKDVSLHRQCGHKNTLQWFQNDY